MTFQTTKFETIVKFCDGDSGSLIDINNNSKMFRMCNIRTPELGETGYQKAKNEVNGMVGRYGGRVTAEVVGMDEYHRLLVYLSNKDGCINQRMINKGYC